MDADVIVVDVFVMDATTDAFCELKMTAVVRQGVKVIGISYIRRGSIRERTPLVK